MKILWLDCDNENEGREEKRRKIPNSAHENNTLISIWGTREGRKICVICLFGG